MAHIKPLPELWLISDARNDAVLEDAIARLPKGSGFVFRHYHLWPDERATRFAALLPMLRDGGHWAIVSDSVSTAEEWGADGVYGALDAIPTSDLRWIATAHNEGEIVDANRYGADAVMLSPVFPTRSHPGGDTLGVDRFRQLAALSKVPVIALGGMNTSRAEQLGWPRWAAIDGLS
ncbi:thiamine monophosphate synthase [Erythrobacter sp. NAP1]|uniref:thiamine phosphate synthase n=1 Tax=Erythrobacter sp. NAP1 TaxID=237727 RepID=UPI00006876E4|nr:thiamine phosphate synthase [Erythrobacter sp. NAP1]EAQ28762.1 thiamine monophosphate synthase [Erythrobacter sp. NAP1]